MPYVDQAKRMAKGGSIVRYKLLPEKIRYLLDQYGSLLGIYQDMRRRTEEILLACEAREWVRVEELSESREQFIAEATKIQDNIRTSRQELLAFSAFKDDTDEQILEVARQTGMDKKLKAIWGEMASQLLAIQEIDNRVSSSITADLKDVQTKISDLKQFRRIRQAYLQYPEPFPEAIFFDKKK